MSPVTFETVTSPDRLRELAASWNGLWERVPGSAVTESFDHALSGWEAYRGIRSPRLYCLIGWQGDDLVFTWPFRVHRRLIFRIMSPIGPGAGEYTAPLSLDLEISRAALRYLLEHAPVDLLRLSAIKHCSGIYQDIRRLPDVVVSDGSYFETRPDWTGSGSPTLSRSGRHRRKAENALRQLAKLGPVAFEVVETRADVAELVDWIISRKRVWSERGGRSSPWLWADAYGDYLRGLVLSGLSPLRPVAFVLKSKDSPIAVKLAAYGRDQLDLIVAGHDPGYDRYSPGTRLDEHWIGWAHRLRLQVDLGMGVEQYKSALTDNNQKPLSSLLIPTSAAGRLLIRCRGIVFSLNHFVFVAKDRLRRLRAGGR